MTGGTGGTGGVAGAVRPTPGAHGRRRAGRQALIVAALFLLALVVLGFEASSAPFEADEADYTATSRYFGYWFEPGGLRRSEWDGNHWTRTQPPLTRYIVGAWLMARGYDLESLNQPYVSTASSFEVNRRKGRVPADDVLAAARQPMVLLGAAALTLLYPLGLLLAGPLAGLLAFGLAASSPFLRYTLVHAWAEAPLACFLLLAALLAALAARDLAAGRPVTDGSAAGGVGPGRTGWLAGGWLRWGIGLGLALGLASATKLTGLVGAPLTAAGVALLLLWHWSALAAAQRRALALLPAAATAVLLLLIVAVNPFLWRGPADGLASMVAQRQREMAEQQEQWPEYAVLSVAERPWLMAIGVTNAGPWGDVTPVAVAVGLGLGLLGVLASVRRLGGSAPAAAEAPGSPEAEGGAARRDDGAAVAMLLVWLAGYAAAIMAGLGLNYPRYFLPAALLLLPFMGAGAALLIARVVGFGFAARRAESATAQSV